MKHITLEHSLVAVWMKALLDAAKDFFSYANVNFVFRKVRITRMTKALVVD